MNIKRIPHSMYFNSYQGDIFGKWKMRYRYELHIFGKVYTHVGRYHYEY